MNGYLIAFRDDEITSAKVVGTPKGHQHVLPMYEKLERAERWPESHDALFVDALGTIWMLDEHDELVTRVMSRDEKVLVLRAIRRWNHK